jgi:tryptophan-rich sensory protein
MTPDNWIDIYIIFSISIVGAIASYFVIENFVRWYKILILPKNAPSEKNVYIVWSVMYTLLIGSTIIFWHSPIQGIHFVLISILYILSGIINIIWSYVLFQKHLIYPSLYFVGAMAIEIFILFVLLLFFVPLSAVLVIPYLVWSVYSFYLNYQIFKLNKPIIA